jgi:plasmid segregation protein ParM
MKTVIAVDIGHSATKILAQTGELRREILFPSVVSPHFEIDEPRARAAAEAETVQVAGSRFFYGDTALLQGRAEAESQLTDDWLSSSTYLALLGACTRELRRRQVPVDGECIVLGGLPARLFAAQSESLSRLMRGQFQRSQVLVLPQPLAPYFAVSFDADGSSAGRQGGAWGVVDAGTFTLDVALVRESTWIQRCSGSAKGAFIAAEHLAKALGRRFNTQVSTLTAHQLLSVGESATFRVYGQAHPIHAEIAAAKRLFAEEVLGFVDRLLEREAASLDGILLVGGAAPLLASPLRQRFPHVVTPDNPRFAVAEGMLRAGLAAARAESRAAPAQAIQRAA